MGVDQHICFPCNGTAHCVDNGKSLCPQRFRQPQSCQTVGSFAGLGDDDDQIALSHQRFPIAEFRSDVHRYRHPCQLFNDILAHCSGMHCRTAGNYLNMPEFPQHLRCDAAFLQIRQAVLNPRQNGVANRVGLFVDLFQHKVGIAALADRLHIPVCGFQFLFHRLPERIEDLYAVVVQHSNFLVFQQIVISGVFDDCRHIRGNKAFALADTHDQRAFAADSVHLLGVVCEDNAQRIGTFQIADGFRNGLNGAAVIAVVQQLCHHFGVSVAGKGHAFSRKEVLEFLIVLDDAVMYDRHSAAAVGVSVYVRGFAMGRPAGVTNAHMPERSALTLHFFLQIFQSALGLRHSDFSVLKDSNAGRVIAAVFQFSQTVQQDLRTVPFAHISNNSTHLLCLTFVFMAAPHQTGAKSLHMHRVPNDRTLHIMATLHLVCLRNFYAICQKI